MSAPEPQTYEDRKAAQALERGDTAEAARWMRIKAVVDKAPPLTPGQIAQLRVLLAPEVAKHWADKPQAA
ncbi:hypothetical protein [Streptomyces lydicus]|uniref:hypothetical protein n=1 Tax=Streptomyces lydicus TaxID=47763 RepID=UPI00379023DA